MAVTNFDVAPFWEAVTRAGETAKRDVQARAMQAASNATARVVSEYPSVTGRLRSGVTWGVGSRRVTTGGRVGSATFSASGGLGAWVWSRAPHAWWHEYGTTTRQAYTRKSAPRGHVEGHGTFVRIMQQERAAMYAEFEAILARTLGSV